MYLFVRVKYRYRLSGYLSPAAGNGTHPQHRIIRKGGILSLPLRRGGINKHVRTYVYTRVVYTNACTHAESEKHRSGHCCHEEELESRLQMYARRARDGKYSP